MKKQFLKFGIVAFLSLLAVGCNSDDDNNNNDNPAAEGSFVATIDGNAYSSSNIAGAALTNGVFNVTAIVPTTNEVIAITVSNPSVGTFNLGPATGSISGAVYTINGESSFVSLGIGGSGEITITQLDTENMKASGTFSFVGVRENITGGVETINITNGGFNNITLATEIPGNANSVLAADIDGVALNANSVRALEITFQGETNISVTANNTTTNQNLSLQFPSNVAVGTYNLSAFGDYVAFYNPNLGGGSTVFPAESGTISITSHVGNMVEGTFNFVASDFIPTTPSSTFVITNGTFSIEVE